MRLQIMVPASSGTLLHRYGTRHGPFIVDLLGKVVIVHIAMLLYQRVRTLSQLFPSGFGMIMKKLGSIPHIYIYACVCILVVRRLSGWWFGIFFIFPYVGNHNPN